MTKFDVAVIGGGTGGVPAAVASARRGARTLLVERYGFLGGMATGGLVNPYMPYRAGGKTIVRGIFAETLSRLQEAGGLAENKATFDEEILKFVLDNLVNEAGVSVLFHSTFVSCRTNNGRIESVTLASKGGLFDIEADIFIDATGDADLAAAAGATIEMGRDGDGLCQPMTLCFRIAGIDASRIPDDLPGIRKKLNTAYFAAKAAGDVTNPRQNILVFRTLREDVLHFNTTRVTGQSPVSPEGLSAAEFEGRRQTRKLAELFKEKVPGFENCYIQKMAVLIGVRESRRVLGGYVLTVDDVLEGHKFPDGIACSSYPVDIHNPSGSGTVIRHVPKGDYYEIPYRSIVPSGIENLLMASRSISATHEAHASLRVMPVVTAIGEAAGAAAAMAVSDQVAPAAVDTSQLRAVLREAGAFVGENI